jgi:hypothetical protein
MPAMNLNRLLNDGDPRTPQELAQALQAAQPNTPTVTGAASVLPARRRSNVSSVPPRQQLQSLGPRTHTQQQQTQPPAVASSSTVPPAGSGAPPPTPRTQVARPEGRRRYVPLSLTQQGILQEMRRVPGFDPSAQRGTVYAAMLQHNAGGQVAWYDDDMRAAAGITTKEALMVRRQFTPDWTEVRAIKTHVATLNDFPHAGTPMQKATALIQLNRAQNLNWQPLDIAKAAGADWSDETTIVTMAMPAIPQVETIRNDVQTHGKWKNQKKHNYLEVLVRNDARVAANEPTWSRADMRLAADITKNDANEVDAMHRRDGTAAGAIQAAMANDRVYKKAGTAAKRLRLILDKNAHRVRDGHPPWEDADMTKAVGLTSTPGGKVIAKWRADQGG